MSQKQSCSLLSGGQSHCVCVPDMLYCNSSVFVIIVTLKNEADADHMLS